MKKNLKTKFMAGFLALLMVFTSVIPVSALELGDNTENPYSGVYIEEEQASSETPQATEDNEYQGVYIEAPSQATPSNQESDTPPLRGEITGNVSIEEFVAQFASGAKLVDGKYVWTPQTAAPGHAYSFRVNYALSGEGELEAGSFRVKIPAQVLKNRNGMFADTYLMSVPSEDEAETITDEAELEQLNLVYREEVDPDTGERFLLVYNTKEMSAAENGYFEVSYVTSEKTTSYKDMSELGAFNATIELVNGENVTSQLSQDIPVYMDTQVKIQNTDKRYPTKFDEWQSSWGDKPADADDYIFVLWEIRSMIYEDSTQPYDFSIDDSIVESSHGSVEPYLYRFSGQRKFSSQNYVENQQLTGYRYDYVITRQPKEIYTPLTKWSIVNKEIATVHPKDNIDNDSNATSQRKFVWEKPQFKIPNGHFNMWKRADGAWRTFTEQNRSIFYGTTGNLYYLGLKVGEYSRYDLQDFQNGNLTKYDEFDYAVWEAGYPYPWTVGEGLDPYNPDSYGITPVKYVLLDDGVYLGDGDETTDKLTSDDFQIDYISYNVKMNDADYSESELKFISKNVTYTDNDILSFYGKFGSNDEWVLMATHNLKTGEKWFDESMVKSMDNVNSYPRLVLQDNCVAYKIETENAHYFTEIDTVPSLSLKNSEFIMNFIEGKDSISLKNHGEGHFYDNDGNVILDKIEEDTNFARITQIDSEINKKVVASANNTKAKTYTITWKLHAEEIATFGEGTQSYITQSSGIFYDLLPEGCTFDADSVLVKTENGYVESNAYDIKLIPNYKGSGQTLAKITIKEPSGLYDVFFDTVHAWDSIKDYGRGVYNPIAFETGNDRIVYGYPDNGGVKNLEDDIIWNDEDIFDEEHSEFVEFFTDLDPETDAEKFIYSQEFYDIEAITAAASGLTKKVLANGDTSYKYNATTTKDGYYQYRLRFMNSFTSKAKNIVLFDSIENYTNEEIKSDWWGTLQAIDLSQPVLKGILPKLYVHLDLTDDGIRDVISIEENNDLTDSSVWTLADENTDLSKVTAIAIDLSKTIDGEEFVLEEGESITVLLYMQAPSEAASDNDYPLTHNNVFVRDTLINMYNDETDFFIHQDYTTVKYLIMKDISLKKVNANNPDEAIKDIKFRLRGTSDYGTDVDSILQTDINGEIVFSNIEKGEYILQEYESTDDWLLDATEHRVVIDGEAKVWIDDVEYTDITYVVEDSPRIHGDLTIKKLPEILTPPEEITDGTQQGDTSTENENGIQGTTFKLSGTSAYGNDIVMLETTNQAGKITFRNIELGTYILEEVIPNENYVINNTKWVVTVDDNANVAVTAPEEEALRDRLYQVEQDGFSYILRDENRFWDFYVRKIDASNESLWLEGATFTLTGVSDFGTEYALESVSNEQGRVDFRHIERGTYILQETQAPTGLDETGHVGGNRNYIKDPKQYIVTINETGLITIEGLTNNENNDIVVKNERALDGKITITKIWNDFDPSNRQTPRLHLTTREIGIERNITVNINWTGEDDSPETRPDSISLYVVNSSGELIESKICSGNDIVKNADGTWTVKMPVFVQPSETYYVFGRNAVPYICLNNEGNLAPIIVSDTARTAQVTYQKAPVTMLITGDRFSSSLKNLANNSTSFGAATVDNAIKHFVKSATPPSADENTIIISTPESGFPVYAWWDADTQTIYYYSDADVIYMNTNASNMFNRFQALEDADVGDLNTSKTTNMANLFQYDWNLLTVDVSKWDTKNVKSMAALFYHCRKINGLDVSGWDTSSLTSISQICNSCYELTEFDVSDWDTSRCTDFYLIFGYCKKLKNIDVSEWETGNVTRMIESFSGMGELTSLDVSGWDTKKATSMSGLFNGCSKVPEIDVSGFVTSNVTNMQNMFNGCSSITELDVSSFDTSKVTTMSGMFRNCKGLSELDLTSFDTSKVADMSGMFQGDTFTTIDLSWIECNSLKNMDSMFKDCKEMPTIDLSPMDTSKVTNMTNLFQGCTGLTSIDLSPMDTSAVTTFAGMFDGCTALPSVDVTVLDTTSAKNMARMFKSCKFSSIDVSKFKTGSVTDMQEMFYACSNLTSLDVSNFDTSSVTNLGRTFQGLSNLTSLDLGTWKTPSLTSLYYTFHGCGKLTSLNVNSLDVSNVTTLQDTFNSCGSLTELDLSSWNTANVKNMDRTFASCGKLVDIYVSELWSNASVTSSSGMFRDDRQLPNWDGVQDVTHANYSDTGYFTYRAPSSTLGINDIDDDDNILEKIAKLFATEVRAAEDDIASGTSGTCSWAIDSSGVLTIAPTEGDNGTLGSPTSNGWPWTDYASQITKVVIANGVKTGANCSKMFSGFVNCTEMDLANLDTANATNMSSMFNHCDKIQTLNVGHFNVSHVTNMNSMFKYCGLATSIDVASWDVSNVTNMASMFEECDILPSLEVSNWNTGSVTTMGDMFYYCPGLKRLDVSNWDTKNVTNMSGTFYRLETIPELDVSRWNTSKVTNIYRMFDRDYKLTNLDVSNWDTSNITNMCNAFSGLSGITTTIDVSSWDTSKVTNFSGLFQNCSNLTSLDVSGFNTEKATNMSNMFSNCAKVAELDVSGFVTDNVTNMSSMFNKCSTITELDVSGFNTSKVTNMNSMFGQCSNLSEINVSGFDTSKVTNMQGMFRYDKATIDLSGFDTSNVTTMYEMFLYANMDSVDLSSFDTSNVTDFRKMFDNARFTKLDITSFDTSSATQSARMMAALGNLQVLQLSSTSNIQQATFYSGNGVKWIHRTDEDGNRLYDETEYTADDIMALSPQEAAGKWVRVGYIEHNPLGDGDVEYISEDNGWVKNGNVWTYTFDVFDDTLEYYLYEETMDGYLSDAMNNYVIVNGDGNITKEATIVNTAEVEKGSLEVAKSVTGLSTSQKFDFTITLTGPSIGGTQIFSNTVFTNGVAHIKLSDGDSKIFDGIPVGTTYNVYETPVNSFITTPYNESGNIVANSTRTARFVNEYIVQEQGSFDVILEKLVTGEYENTDEFAFIAQFTGLAPVATYTTSNPDVTIVSDENGNASIAFTLKANENINFIALPEGSTYMFTEEAGDYISSYKITDANSGVNIVSSAKANTDVDTALSTAQETVDNDEAIVVSFTNEIHRTVNLTLTKQVVSEKEINDAFTFDIYFYNMPKNAKINSSIGRFLPNEDGESHKTASIRNGESITFENIPVGTYYKIVEKESKLVAAYTIVDNNGKDNIVSVSAENEKNKTPLETEIETANEDEDVVVTFINTYVPPQTVTVKFDKTITGTDEAWARLALDKNATYNFQISMINVETGAIINGILTNKGELVFGNVPLGTYEVYEADDNYFDFVSMLGRTQIEGVMFDGMTLTITDDVPDNAVYTIDVTNKLEPERYYEDKEEKSNYIASLWQIVR